MKCTRTQVHQYGGASANYELAAVGPEKLRESVAPSMLKHTHGCPYAMTNTHEAAQRLGVSRQTLLRWFREGRVADTIKRDRNGWREFSAEDIEAIRKQTGTA